MSAQITDAKKSLAARGFGTFKNWARENRKARAGWNDGKKAAEAQRSAAIERFFAPGGEYDQMSDVQKMMCTKFEW